MESIVARDDHQLYYNVVVERSTVRKDYKPMVKPKLAKHLQEDEVNVREDFGRLIAPEVKVLDCYDLIHIQANDANLAVQ